MKKETVSVSLMRIESFGKHHRGEEWNTKELCQKIKQKEIE